MNVKDEQFTHELIEQIAAPILETLLKLQEEMGPEYLDQPFTVHLESPDLENEQFQTQDGAPSGVKLDSDFLQQLEEYIQLHLDEWYRPTILH